MAVVGVQHYPIIAAHYARKRAAAKCKMNALGQCMRKALAIVAASGATGPTSTPTGGSRLDETLWYLVDRLEYASQRGNVRWACARRRRDLSPF